MSCPSLRLKVGGSEFEQKCFLYSSGLLTNVEVPAVTGCYSYNTRVALLSGLRVLSQTTIAYIHSQVYKYKLTKVGGFQKVNFIQNMKFIIHA